jgi:hypothetical protein
LIRTIEVLLVILIIAGAYIAVSSFAVLPSPRQVSPVNLRRLSLTTIQVLDSNFDLSEAVFEVNNASLWSQVQVALSASLPPNVVYNMTVYEVGSGETGGQFYSPVKSISNAETLGITSDASSYFATSSNVTFKVTPEKIGESSGGGTLYILNCSDASGWWITGYTAQSLADDLYKMLAPYFSKTIMVQNTAQLRQLLDNQTISGLPGEKVQNAVVINTLGESAPMPQEYYQGQSRANEGYDPNAPKGSGYDYGYARYCYTLGQKTRLYNWTWASIVGYPFYYVSNTGALSASQNGWGLYGMQMTAAGGSRAFLQGLDKQSYKYNATVITDSADRQVSLKQTAIESCNYYGIYPSSNQTSTRAIADNIRPNYNLTIGLNIFNPIGGYNPGTIYNHVSAGSSNITGSLLALGLTRTPDVRVPALSLLSYYHPRLYSSEYTASGTSRVIVLQLGLAGGI